VHRRHPSDHRPGWDRATRRRGIAKPARGARRLCGPRYGFSASRAWLIPTCAGST
jgi:hypothetical protein